MAYAVEVRTVPIPDFDAMTNEEVCAWIADGPTWIARDRRYHEVQAWERERRRKANAALIVSEQERTGIVVGTLVRRKSGKANTGTVVGMWVRDRRRVRGEGWLPCSPYVEVEVHWTGARRWLNGGSDWHSKVRLTSLVKV